MNEQTKKVSQALPSIAEELSRRFEDIANQKLGFTLIVYTPERASYISNCNRDDVAKALKILAESMAAGMPDIPAHQVH